MEFDIVPELLEKIKSDYEKNMAAVNSEEVLNKLFNSGNYEDAYDYAKKMAKALSDSYINNITTDVLPNGRMYYNIANRIFPETIKNAYLNMAVVTTNIQENINKKARIGIKAQTPSYNADRARGIVDKISEADSFNDVKFLIKPPVIENITQSVVDDTIKTNAEFHYKSGIRARVERKLGGKCCDWCQKLVGIYSYPDVPEDVYRRHDNCRCTVTYYPSKTGKGQDVWSKQVVDKNTLNKLQLSSVNKKRIEAIASGKNCYDATDDWYQNKRNYSVIQNNDKHVNIAGTRYEVDGKHIIFNPSESEKKAAKLLVDSFGGKIELNPRVNFPQNVKLADYYYNEKSVDLKTIEGSSKHVIYNILKNKENQSKTFVIDISSESITKNMAIDQIENDVFRSSHTRFIDAIILIKNNKILNVFQRI